MSPLPVRSLMKASFFPSGEYIGRDSVAGCDTSRCASPPREGATHMSPPETNAISEPSGESEGSESMGAVAWAEKASARRTSARFIARDSIGRVKRES